MKRILSNVAEKGNGVALQRTVWQRGRAPRDAVPDETERHPNRRQQTILGRLVAANGCRPRRTPARRPDAARQPRQGRRVRPGGPRGPAPHRGEGAEGDLRPAALAQGVRQLQGHERPDGLAHGRDERVQRPRQGPRRQAQRHDRSLDSGTGISITSVLFKTNE